MGKKKKVKKNKPLKTFSFRENEINEVKNKLKTIGFSENNPDVEYAYKIFDDYVKYGTAYTGKIKINGFKRVLELILSNREHIKSTICLKYQEDI